MKLYCYFALLSMLTACSSVQIAGQEKGVEHIQSLLFDKNNNIIYALGSKFDYQVYPCTASWGEAQINNIKTDEQCLRTLHYGLAHPEQVLDINIELNIQTGASTRVHGYYQRYLKLDSTQAHQYINNKQLDLRPLNNNELSQLNQKLQSRYTQEQVFKAHTWFQGNTVQMQNKSQLMALGHLQTPLQVPIRILQQEKSYSLAPIGKAASALMVLPVGLVLMVPYGAVIAYCEAGQNCN